jgi:pimeloyl-ACP methyl ester carboxylesterase
LLGTLTVSFAERGADLLGIRELDPFPHQLNVSRRMLQYQQHGCGDPVVLVHGWLGGAAVWTPLVSHLSPHFEVISPDLPGFAGSADEAVPETLEGFAATIFDLLNSLGVGQFRLLGHSAGGMIAQQMALSHPDRVKKLVLVGTSCRGALPGRFETIDESITRLRAEGVKPVADYVAPIWFVDGRQSPYHDLSLKTALQATPKGAINCLSALHIWSACKLLHKIAMPTLVVCGERDRGAVVEESLTLWRGIPNAQLCIIPNCAHNVHLEAPHVFNQIVANFL